MILRIDHIGIAVAHLEKAVQVYSGLFGKSPDREELVSGQKVRVAMFRAGEASVELLEGATEDSPIRKFVRERGEGMHHICLAVVDLEKALTAASAAGMSRIALESDYGAGGHRIAFLHPKTTGGVLIELREEKP